MIRRPTYWVIDCQHSDHPPLVAANEGDAIRLAAERGDARVNPGKACHTRVVSYLPSEGLTYSYRPARLTPTVTSADEADDA